MTTILGTCDYCGRETQVMGLDFQHDTGVYGSFACKTCEAKTSPSPAAVDGDVPSDVVDWRAIAEQLYPHVSHTYACMKVKKCICGADEAGAAYRRALAAEGDKERDR